MRHCGVLGTLSRPMPVQTQTPQMLVFVIGFCMFLCVSASRPSNKSQVEADSKAEWDTESFKVGLFWEGPDAMEGSDAILGIYVLFDPSSFGSNSETIQHVCTNPTEASEFASCNGGNLEENSFITERDAEQRYMAGRHWWTSYVKRKEFRPGFYDVFAYFVNICGAGIPPTTTPTTTIPNKPSMFSLNGLSKIVSHVKGIVNDQMNPKIDDHEIECTPCVTAQKVRAMVRVGNETKAVGSKVTCTGGKKGLTKLFRVVIHEDGSIL